MSSWFGAAQSNKTSLIAAARPILKATDDAREQEERMETGPLSHHPHLWRLVCLECIKPGLSGFPVKTGCLPLGCLIALCSLQDGLA